MEGYLGGMFKYLTPRQMIEEYIDPTIEKLSKIPMYKGGSKLQNPFVSLNVPVTTPYNIDMAYYTGTDDYLLTRSFATWHNRDYISVKRKEYTSIT